MMQSLLTEKDVSRILGLAIQSLRNDRAGARRIPYVKIGKSVRYRCEDIERLIENCRIEARG